MYKNASRFTQHLRETGWYESGRKKSRSGSPKSKKGDQIDVRADQRKLRDWFAYLDACEAQGNVPVGVPDEIRAAYRTSRTQLTHSTGAYPPFLTGTVTFYLPAEGHGQIRSDGSRRDVVVLARHLRLAGLDVLNAGQRVSFQIAKVRKKLQARQIRIIGEQDEASHSGQYDSPVGDD
ncbi:MAG: cold shock domain-containing protein [Nitratireductor sp.]